MILPLVMLFVLGGMQGLIGWIMVSTGIDTENVYVTHFSLATHFMAAMVLIGYTYLFALSLRVPASQRVASPGIRKLAFLITIVLALQLVYGAFMAGLKAASAAPTWPTINGSLIPADLLKMDFQKALCITLLPYNSSIVRLLMCLPHSLLDGGSKPGRLSIHPFSTV